ncbi:MAG: sugar transferase [Anaerolineae bacterium]|nr:sugar transferase [Anaerolineae bacterium]
MNDTKPEPKLRGRRLRMGERRIILIFGDLIMATVSLVAGLYVWAAAETFQKTFLIFLRDRPDRWFFLLPLFWLILLVESYDTHRSSDWSRTLRGVAYAAVLGVGLYLIFFFIDPRALPRRGVAVFVAGAVVLTLLWRWVYIRIFTAPGFLRRVLLVGAGSTGEALLQVIARLDPQPFHLVGVIDDDKKKIGKAIHGFEVLGDSSKLLSYVQESGVSDVIVAISGRMGNRMFQALLAVQESGVEITRMPVAYEELLRRVPVEHLEADWILRSFVDEAKAGNFYETWKRLLDIIGGLVGVAILALITPFVSLAIYLDGGRPIVFKQTRAGKWGRPYTIMKFRTMRHDAEKDGAQLAKEDDMRATKIGRFMRKTRLDEWPQFINVLRGEMSLVGPRPERPELMRHFEEQIPFYRGRLLDKPGITGWAQVNYGYPSSVEQMTIKLEYDLYYIKHRSILLDLVIILRTFGTVIGFRGQ